MLLLFVGVYVTNTSVIKSTRDSRITENSFPTIRAKKIRSRKFVPEKIRARKIRSRKICSLDCIIITEENSVPENSFPGLYTFMEENSFPENSFPQQ